MFECCCRRLQEQARRCRAVNIANLLGTFYVPSWLVFDLSGASVPRVCGLCRALTTFRKHLKAWDNDICAHGYINHCLACLLLLAVMEKLSMGQGQSRRGPFDDEGFTAPSGLSYLQLINDVM